MSNTGIIKKQIAVLERILAISRPRIWMYTAGPFAFGFLFWHRDFNFFLDPAFLYLFLWLTFPANLFLYALNDAFDYETDIKNPKKQGFELKSSMGDRSMLLGVAAISAATFLFLFFKLPLFIKAGSIIWFLIILTYNIPPFRFKAVPGADLLFALNYYFWGVFGYYLASGGQLPSLLAVVLMALFGITMHIYSSSGDIEYDRDAGIRTISTVLGSIRANIQVCVLLCSAILVISSVAGIWYVSLAVLPYVIFFLAQLWHNPETRFLYWYRNFISLHLIAGGILTMFLI